MRAEILNADCYGFFGGIGAYQNRLFAKALPEGDGDVVDKTYKNHLLRKSGKWARANSLPIAWIQTIKFPLGWIGVNVFPNPIQFHFIANDVFPIIALP